MVSEQQASKKGITKPEPIIWDKLSQQEQQVLQSIFEVDQEQAEEHRKAYYEGAYMALAEEWRPIEYGYGSDQLPSLLLNKLESISDQVFRTTLDALQEKKLITWEMTNKRRFGRTGRATRPLILIEPAGRRLVKKSLGITPRKKGELTQDQQKYADAIIAAGLAPREDVENAFRLPHDQGKPQIDAWNRGLRKQRQDAEREAMQAYRESKTRMEPCAYPGCTESIKVYKSEVSYENIPQPTRRIILTYEVPGYHRVGKHNRRNTETIERELFACSPVHAEGIMRLKIDIVITQDVAEEQRISSIRYPLKVSHEARWAVDLLARNAAISFVAPPEPETPLLTTKPEMRALAKQILKDLVSAATRAERNGGQQLTDDLPAFQRLYVKHFVIGYEGALYVRDCILKRSPGSQSWLQDERWQPLYAWREQQPFPEQ